jgi:DNA topoisomerase-3
MRLFIAEKPSLARAIALALPGPHQRAKTHIACGGGNVVAWCAGHILETAPPEAYGAHHKKWRMGDLPIAPRDWKLAVSRPELLTTIQRLLRDATRVVHAGDPDREGQLLVDEVLEFLGYRGPVDRLLIRDLSPAAVRTQLAALEPNTKYRPLYESALARQRADWLYGMNMTRLYTLLGRASGYDGVLSVGRVQTPLLGLIVARDRAIAEFQPAPYYVVGASIRASGGESFRALWLPGPDAEPYLDEDKRLLKRAIAEAVRDRVDGHTGSVTAHTQDKRSEPSPLPYSLADLQMDAGRRLGMSAQAVLDVCQSLYETHRLTTYPRSDCAYLPEAHHAQARDVVAAVVRHAPSLAVAAAGASLTVRSKAWNDKRVSAHHAIIPTPTVAAPPAQLSGSERAVYELIARRYLAQFYPAHEYLQTKVAIDIAGETFTATGRQVLATGWKVLLADAPRDDTKSDDGLKPDRDSAPPLPRLAQGDAVTADDVAVGDKRTQPPKAFTDSSLIAAMCAVAKFVSSPHIKKILSETDGIGTPATRAAIIETLFERGYVSRDKKTIVSTETGRALIGCLPEVATTPDMTAVWEAAMRAITDGSQSLDAFLARVGSELAALVAQGRALGRITVPASSASSTRSTPPARTARPSRASRSPARSPSVR